MTIGTSRRAGWDEIRRGARRPLAIGLVLSVLLAQVASVSAGDTAALTAAVDPYLDVVPGALPAVERLAGTFSDVTMDVALDPVAGTIGGEMTVTWRNPSARPLADVWFRLYPNAYYYTEGGLTVSAVTVDGVAVTPELTQEETALGITLPRPVPPGESAEIALDFTTTIPADSTGSFGIFNHDTDAGAWVLADWFPILAIYEEGSGWALPEVTSLGDPTYAPSVFYDVRVAAPDALDVVATGVAAGERAGDGVVTRRFVAGPARDFVIVADDALTPLRQTVDGTELTLWTAPELDPTVAAQTMAIASGALRYYNELFGPYPGREVDLVQTDPSGALGVAWSGLLFLDGPALLGSYGEHDPHGLAAVVAHEMAHLWWGILIGGDSNKHGFIQEGLATVSAMLYLDDTFGAEAARAELDAWVTGPARQLLAAGDAVVDQPNADDQDANLRSAAIYGKGTLGFLAIRDQVGAGDFAAGLHDAATRYAWVEMTPEQLRESFAHASGANLDALWSRWFDETGMTQDEIDTIVAGFGSGG